MKTAYIFPGQGSQYAGMGLDLYLKYPTAKAVFDEADRVLGFSLSQLCFEGPDGELKKTVNAQPSLLTMSIACLEAAREILPEPSFMAGHSLGEYSALTAAGALDFSTALSLALERGRLMYEAGLVNPGGMAAVIGMNPSLLGRICEETGAYIANLNCPGQIVISGATDCVKEAIKLARERGAKIAIPLQVSGAFHSPLMRSASDGLKDRIQSLPLMSHAMQAAEVLRSSLPKVTVNIEYDKPDYAEIIQGTIESTFIRPPFIPVIGNTQVQLLRTAADVRTELTEQVCSCVRWEDTIRYMLAEGVDLFVEIGPGQVLTGLLKRIAPDAKHINIGKVEDIEGAAI